MAHTPPTVITGPCLSLCFFILVDIFYDWCFGLYFTLLTVQWIPLKKNFLNTRTKPLLTFISRLLTHRGNHRKCLNQLGCVVSGEYKRRRMIKNLDLSKEDPHQSLFTSFHFFIYKGIYSLFRIYVHMRYIHMKQDWHPLLRQTQAYKTRYYLSRSVSVWSLGKEGTPLVHLFLNMHRFPQFILIVFLASRVYS